MVKGAEIQGGNMERLTEKQSAGYDLKEMNGNYCDDYCKTQSLTQSLTTCNDCGIYEAIQRLAEYEDTGLTPEEIESLKENYEMSRTGVQNLSAKLVKLDEERKYWQNEAFKWASELGEQKIERGKNERN